jgi:hypothetical protein
MLDKLKELIAHHGQAMTQVILGVTYPQIRNYLNQKSKISRAVEMHIEREWEKLNRKKKV